MARSACNREVLDSNVNIFLRLLKGFLSIKVPPYNNASWLLTLTTTTFVNGKIITS